MGRVRDNDRVTEEVEKGIGHIGKIWLAHHLAIGDPMNGGCKAVNWNTGAYKAMEGPASQCAVQDLHGTDFNNMIIGRRRLEIECDQP